MALHSADVRSMCSYLNTFIHKGNYCRSKENTSTHRPAAVRSMCNYLYTLVKKPTNVQVRRSHQYSLLMYLHVGCRKSPTYTYKAVVRVTEGVHQIKQQN